MKSLQKIQFPEMHLLQMKHPLHHKLLENKKNETTIPNESTLQLIASAASNDVNKDENEIEILTMSNKRTFNEDSSEEDTTNPLPAKKAATSSPASEQSGTRVPREGRGRST